MRNPILIKMKQEITIVQRKYQQAKYRTPATNKNKSLQQNY